MFLTCLLFSLVIQVCFHPVHSKSALRQNKDLLKNDTSIRQDRIVNPRRTNDEISDNESNNRNAEEVGDISENNFDLIDKSEYENAEKVIDKDEEGTDTNASSGIQWPQDIHNHGHGTGDEKNDNENIDAENADSENSKGGNGKSDEKNDNENIDEENADIENSKGGNGYSDKKNYNGNIDEEKVDYENIEEKNDDNQNPSNEDNEKNTDDDNDDNTANGYMLGHRLSGNRWSGSTEHEEDKSGSDGDDNEDRKSMEGKNANLSDDVAFGGDESARGSYEKSIENNYEDDFEKENSADEINRDEESEDGNISVETQSQMMGMAAHNVEGPQVKAAEKILPDDYDQVTEEANLREYNRECPRVCPARDVMVCARCKHKIHKTFLSICHLRMYSCKYPDERFELVGRTPCLQGGPVLVDLPKANSSISEPGDKDAVLNYVLCRDDGTTIDGNPDCHYV